MLGTVDYDNFSRRMTDSAVHLGGALRYALGDHFEQHYPASAEHRDGAAVNGSDEVYAVYHRWLAATLEWRTMCELKAEERRNRPKRLPMIWGGDGDGGTAA